MSVSILPNYPKMTLAMVEGNASPIRLTLVSGVTTACCPGCGTPSARICSTYRRKLQEIPYGSAAVELQLIVHRFRCDVDLTQVQAYFLGASWPRVPRRATTVLSQRLADDPAYRQVWTLTRHFHALVSHRCGEKALAAWCRIAEASNIPEVVAFVTTLRQDWDAVAAGVTQAWSQGPVEGFNTRTKLLKQMMYGRAKLPLLRARILYR